MDDQSTAQPDNTSNQPVTNEPSFAPPPNSFFGKLSNAFQSIVQSPQPVNKPPQATAPPNVQTTQRPPTVQTSPPVAVPRAQNVLRLFMREQPALEFKLHYFEPPPSPSRHRTEIQQLQGLIKSQIKSTSDQGLWNNLENLLSGELEQKGFFKIQHGYYDHYVRKFLQPNPTAWIPTDFWLKLPSETRELIPADLYQYDMGAVIQSDEHGKVRDATLILYINKEGRVGRPKPWEKKTAEELKAIARNYLNFVGVNENPQVGNGTKGGEPVQFIAMLNETPTFIRQCCISQDGFIRIDLIYR